MIRKFLIFLAVVSIVFTGACVLFAMQPDRTLTFSKTWKNKTPSATIADAIDSPELWPRWHHHLTQVEPHSAPPVIGQVYTWTLVPTKKEWRQYTLTVKLTEYLPGRKLAFELLTDSSQKIPKLFENVHWSIEQSPDGRTLSGTLHATTHHAKARIFASLAGSVVMNQLFYPDVHTFSSFKEPFTPRVPKVAPPPTPY